MKILLIPIFLVVWALLAFCGMPIVAKYDSEIRHAGRSRIWGFLLLMTEIVFSFFVAAFVTGHIGTILGWI